MAQSFVLLGDTNRGVRGLNRRGGKCRMALTWSGTISGVDSVDITFRPGNGGSIVLPVRFEVRATAVRG